MRKDEEFCKDIFDKYLANNLSLHPSNWREGEDPPDYYLTLERHDYAVEITTIMLKVISDSKLIPQKSFHSAIDDLVEEIREEVKKQGILSGNYVISFFGPFGEFKKARILIKKSGIRYIKDTQSKSKAPWEILYLEREQKCEIIKAGITSNIIGHGITSPNYGKWDGEAEQEACQILIEWIRNKMAKLKNKNLPKILLLFNKYPFSGTLIFKKCKIDDEILNFYHSIFIVEPKGDGYFIHSKEKRWV